ncbi:MAG: hypothetical protein ACOYU7_03695 [Bacillota bacterium]|jgi:hypothetical protein
MQKMPQADVKQKWIVCLNKQGFVVNAKDKTQALLLARELFALSTGRKVALEELDGYSTYEAALWVNI